MNGRLVWIDCEMTGLDLANDALIEIAALVTDADLVPLGEGVDVVIHASDEALANMPEVVVDMHAKSGLTEEVRASTVTMAEAEKLVLDYIREHVPDARTAPLCGNSIATDRGFIARDMPELDAHLHYRMIDVSSIKELCRRWYPRIYYAQPEKGLAHRALADARESIRELEYYRRTAFVPLPGPSTDEARAAASDVLAADAAAAGAATATEAGLGGRRDAGAGLVLRSLAGDPRGAGPVRIGSRSACRLVESPGHRRTMVGVAQLAEHWVVIPGVAGSSPVTHPDGSGPPLPDRKTELGSLPVTRR